MSTTTQQDLTGWIGRTLIDGDGDKLGTIEAIYVDDRTDRPEWMTVKSGMFGNKHSFVPTAEASSTEDGVRVPYDKSQLKDAPKIDPDGQLSLEEENQLHEHYGVANDHQHATRDADRDPVGRDTSGPETDEAMTRSEEELRVGTERHESGRARLRKYIVTEEVQTTVPVQREEVRVEREPITDANRGDALDGADLSEEEHEVVLHEEEVVVEKRTVPKERVRMDTETVTEDRQVDETVRKEQIEAQGDGHGSRR